MASAVFRALEPEARSAPTGRSKIEVSRRGSAVEISILSRDLSSMRAAVNTFLRLASACQGALEALEGLGGDRAPHRRARGGP
jgi:tRNA threonylcarbamoyladenosine modification (KEOPS) complex  Pcc1 subunit